MSETQKWVLLRIIFQNNRSVPAEELRLIYTQFQVLGLENPAWRIAELDGSSYKLFITWVFYESFTFGDYFQLVHKEVYLEIHICMHNVKEFVRHDFDVFNVPFRPEQAEMYRLSTS